MDTLSRTPRSERIHIGFFGCRNAGKSSLVNALTGQPLSVVSAVRGTTTDSVSKAMELLPLGAVVLYDTPGIDDDDPELGVLRVQKTAEVLRHTDLAVLVVDAVTGLTDHDRNLLRNLQDRHCPYVIACNKSDLVSGMPDTLPADAVFVSTVTGDGLEALKQRMIAVFQQHQQEKPAPSLLDGLVQREQLILLVTPIDEAAPKGRLILPQVQTIRAVLDTFAITMTVQPQQLPAALQLLKKMPDLVITDSQVFGQVAELLPDEVPLTSFSILFARYKGILNQALDGIRQLNALKDGDTVLISEGCTHHRQCNDIGTVKLPGWIRSYTRKNLNFNFTAGGGFPADLSPYALVVHCGGCMLNAAEMAARRNDAAKQGIPFTNYGLLIAQVHGILERCTRPVIPHLHS